MMSLRFFRSLGFGIERIGLLPLRAPWLAMLALAVFSAYCATGVMKLETDDALSDLFRSQSEVYSDYKVMSDLFPSSERVVFRGDARPPPFFAAARTRGGGALCKAKECVA